MGAESVSSAEAMHAIAETKTQKRHTLEDMGFNRPVAPMGKELSSDSPHPKISMENFYRKYFGDPPRAPHSTKFKADPDGTWHEYTLKTKQMDTTTKRSAKAKARPRPTTS